MEYCEKDLIEWIKKGKGPDLGDLGKPVCAQDAVAKVRDELGQLVCPRGYDGTKSGRKRSEEKAKWRASQVGGATREQRSDWRRRRKLVARRSVSASDPSQGQEKGEPRKWIGALLANGACNSTGADAVVVVLFVVWSRPLNPGTFATGCG